MLFLLCKIMKYGKISFVTLAYYLKETQRQLWVEQIGKPCWYVRLLKITDCQSMFEKSFL